MKWPSSRNSLPNGTVSCTSTDCHGDRKLSRRPVERMNDPQSPVRYSVMTPGARSPGETSSVILAATVYGLEALAPRLECRLERGEHALRFDRVVRRVVAHVDIDRDKAGFRPSVNGEMGLGEQHRTGDALRFELVEAIADDRQARCRDGPEAQLAQRLGLRQRRDVGRASVPFTQQMNTVHRISPPGTAPHAADAGSRSKLGQCDLPEWSRSTGRKYHSAGVNT